MITYYTMSGEEKTRIHQKPQELPSFEIKFSEKLQQ